MRPRPRDTWRLRIPPEQLAKPRAHGGPDGHMEVPDPHAGGPGSKWRSRTHLRGSGSSATGADHFHLWDTWRHRIRPRAGSGSGTVGPVRWSRTPGVRLLSSLGRRRSAFSRAGSLPSSEAEARGAVEGFGGEPSSEAEITPRVRGGCGRAALRTWAVCWASLSSFLSSRLEGGCRPSWARLPNMCLRF